MSKRPVVTRKRDPVLLSVLLILVASIVTSFPLLSLAMKTANNSIVDDSPRHPDTSNTPGSTSTRSDGSKGSGAGTISQAIPSVVSSNNFVAESSRIVTESKISASPLPYLVIHMGPDKTGTTSIQSFLNQYQDLLGDDGYDVSFSKASRDESHRKMAVTLLNCFIFSSYKSHPCHETHALDQVLAAFREKGKYPHILWSTEGFRWANFQANPDWPWFIQYIQSYRTIRIIVVYRRYFDWITSRYQEEHRSSEYSGTGFSTWPDDIIHKNKPGMIIPTFDEYYQRETLGICPDTTVRAPNRDCHNYFVNRLQNNTQGKMEVAHPLLQMVQPLLESNLAVTVINLHGGNDLLETFFCESLPEMMDPSTGSGSAKKKNESRACQQAQVSAARVQTSQPVLLPSSHRRKGQRMMRKSRPSDLDSIQHDMIALEAHRLQILPRNISRNAAKEYIRWYHQDYKQDQDLPWLCPSKTLLQSLEATSYRFEQELLQLDIGQTLVFPEKHADAFARALVENKFCNVNVTKVLEDSELVAFLRNRTVLPTNKKPRSRQKLKRQNTNH